MRRSCTGSRTEGYQSDFWRRFQMRLTTTPSSDGRSILESHILPKTWTVLRKAGRLKFGWGKLFVSKVNGKVLPKNPLGFGKIGIFRGKTPRLGKSRESPPFPGSGRGWSSDRKLVRLGKSAQKYPWVTRNVWRGFSGTGIRI